MKPRHWRIAANTPNNNVLRAVEIRETYWGSGYYVVRIIPEGYGVDPEPITFCRSVGWGHAEIEEGYGIFRVEYAFGLARLLTGQMQIRYPAKEQEQHDETDPIQS